MDETGKKIVVACGIFILLVVILVSCLENDSSSDDYKSYDNGITQQDRDNMEFYKEMEDAWNEKYNLK